jgi:threonine aldolase
VSARTGTSFASDNTAGAHPAVVAALVEAAAGHAGAYGDDPWTERAVALLRETFGVQAEPFLVTTGTAANTLALDQVTRPHHCVICPSTAHIAVDECGAPERHAGVKLVTVPTEDGKLRPADVLARLTGVGDEHRVQPRVVSISQASERGTVYTPDEVTALAEVAHAHGLLLHVDGARLANAAAALGVPARALTTDAGVDVVTLGLTKTGALLAEAVVFLRPELAEEFAFARKQGMQLVSKMRFVGAQVEALLRGGLWLELAAHANAMARDLAGSVADLVDVVHPVEANAVFVRVPPGREGALRAAGALHAWDDGLVRWMTAWDTTADEVERFADRVRVAVG